MPFSQHYNVTEFCVNNVNSGDWVNPKNGKKMIAAGFQNGTLILLWITTRSLSESLATRVELWTRGAELCIFNHWDEWIWYLKTPSEASSEARALPELGNGEWACCVSVQILCKLFFGIPGLLGIPQLVVAAIPRSRNDWICTEWTTRLTILLSVTVLFYNQTRKHTWINMSCNILYLREGGGCWDGLLLEKIKHIEIF